MDAILKRSLIVCLALYTISILVSMAGMEIFGWLSAIFALSLWARSQARFTPLMIGDWALLALLAVVAIGAVVNTPQPKNVVDIIGSFRFVILFLLLRMGLMAAWSERFEKWSYVLVAIAGVIGVYGISQYWTGLDILRGNSHRAVQIFQQDEMGNPLAFRSAGLLSAPITYAYSVGLFVCFPLAFLAVRRWDRWSWLSLGASVAILGSIISSMTRGAWLAIAAAILVMAFYLGRRIAITALTVGVLCVGGAYVLNPTIQERLASIVNPQTRSAADRMLIWQANFAMIKDYPLLGAGYGENERLIGDYYQKLGIDGQVGHAHNNFVQFLAGTGVVGFALYLLFAGFYLYLCHRLWFAIPRERTWARTLVLGALGAQIVLHIGGLTECNFKDAEVNHEFMFVLALVGVLGFRLKESSHDRARA